jgi:hypothetical protein
MYDNEKVIRISENEGYIQMYHQLQSRNQAKVFKIPNPEVYNEDAKSVWNNWKKTNVVHELLKDIITIKLK